MAKKVFYGFILIYTLSIIYDGFHGYIFKDKNDIITNAIVSGFDKNDNPVLEFKINNEIYTYKDRYANKYLFVKEGEKVKIKYQIDLNLNKITEVSIIDFKYQILSIDKIIFHAVILLISFLSICKIYN